MSIRPVNITLDCDEPEVVAKFWSAALESPIGDSASQFFASIRHDDSNLSFFFIKVPEGKQVKNRLHIDFESSDRDAEVERLVGFGATKVAEKDEWNFQWTVMNDPEGNEFCVSGPHDSI